MSRPRLQMLQRQLEDERGKRVIFVSHCVLNENTRYLGGAFRRGCVEELVDQFQQEGLGISQMRCPEQRAWGGVLKRCIVPIYGSRDTILYRWRRLILPLFTWYTRRIYWRMAREVVRDVEDYVRSGFEVVGIVGVGGSPSCGICTTLDLGRSLEVIATCPLAKIERHMINEQSIAACLVDGEGLFIQALRRQLKRKHLPTRFYEHELLAEIRGQPIQLRARKESER